jgi:lipopolysaccharide/colanic/teichoic acid biosynthesis glycosyltransferase
MSFTEAQHQKAVPSQPSSTPAVLSDDGDHIRALSGYGPAKRLFDIVGAVSLLVLVAPLLSMVALAVKLDTRGPVLVRQTRFGAGFRPFKILKFRTAHDDRQVTGLGRFLRRTGLDELPQLWNVLTGDMSLIGPRPYIPRELTVHPVARSVIARVKPGITGLWQVSGRNSTRFQDRIRFDISYVERYSFRQDMAILRRTVLPGGQTDGV